MKLLQLPNFKDAQLLGELVDGAPRFNNSAVGRYFRLNERKSTLVREIRGGVVTFLTIAYILCVNANIIAASGGPCTSEDCTGPDKSFSCRFTDPGFQSCVDQVRIDLITATGASTLIATFLMGAFANMPLAVSTGLGVNAYFTYNVVGFYGTGTVSYKDALAAIFIEGWIFIFLSVTGTRQFLIRLLPRTLSLSMAAGIGLFLAYIGFQGSEGIGVVTADGATLGTLGGCPVENRVRSYFMTEADMGAICTPPPGQTVPFLPAPSSNYKCDGHKMTSAVTWLAIAGFAIMTVLMSRNFRGSIIVGVLFVTIVAWIPGHAASYLGHTSDLPGGIGNTGESRWQYFKKVVAVPTLSKTGGQLDFAGMGNGEVWIALVTFLYVDFLDATGCLFSMSNFMNQYLPNFISDDGVFPRSTLAYCADGAGIIVGSLMGTSPLTVFIESATGIREGGRTGITAIVISLCFFVSLFFAPLLASIPTFATGPALILVGALMMVNAAKIDWMDVRQAVPAFLTIAVMPLTYSIAYGVIAGIVSYGILHFVTLGLDWASKHTNGFFGDSTPHEHIEIDGPVAHETTFRLHRNVAAGDDGANDDSAYAERDPKADATAVKPAAGKEEV